MSSISWMLWKTLYQEHQHLFLNMSITPTSRLNYMALKMICNFLAALPNPFRLWNPILFIRIIESIGFLSFYGNYAQGCQTTQCDDWPRKTTIATNWLGFGRILSSKTGIQCQSCIQILQGTWASGWLSGLFSYLNNMTTKIFLV